MRNDLYILILFLFLSQFASSQIYKTQYSILLSVNGELDSMDKIIIDQIMKENFSMYNEVVFKNNYKKTVLIYENNNLPILNSDNFTLYNINEKTLHTFDENKNIIDKKSVDVFEKLNIIKNTDTILDTKNYRFIELSDKNNKTKYQLFLSNKIPIKINPLPGIIPKELSIYGGAYKLIIVSESTNQIMELQSFKEIKEDKKFEEDIKKIKLYQIDD